MGKDKGSGFNTIAGVLPVRKLCDSFACRKHKALMQDTLTSEWMQGGFGMLMCLAWMLHP